MRVIHQILQDNFQHMSASRLEAVEHVKLKGHSNRLIRYGHEVRHVEVKRLSDQVGPVYKTRGGHRRTCEEQPCFKTARISSPPKA